MLGPQDLWQSLVGTALMGTERQPPSPPPSPAQAEEALGTVLNQLDWHQPERALLGAAGRSPYIARWGSCRWNRIFQRWRSVQQKRCPVVAIAQLTISARC
ncbi:MAG: hypothetical protein HC824_21890 [Synechococcales cyanobacterium RM1_1_8]|nr:hypothetical protein [Synechococcales cyanobacterium RM1_1_8]